LGAERFGVLDIRLAAEPSRALVTELSWVAMALAFALAAAGRATDQVELARRSRPLSLPAEIQWELLPRLARGFSVASRTIKVCTCWGTDGRPRPCAG
jgi:hypothetical protein